MWDTIKKIFSFIGGILAVIGAFLLGRNIHNNKKRAGSTENDIDTAKRNNTEAEGRIDDIKRTAESVTESASDIEHCTDECLGIIKNIEKRGNTSED